MWGGGEGDLAGEWLGSVELPDGTTIDGLGLAVTVGSPGSVLLLVRVASSLGLSVFTFLLTSL